MTMHESKVLLNSFWELSVDIQQAVARFLVGSKLGEIIVAKAHGVTEVEINYFRHGAVYKLIWDDTTKKILGGTEAIVINEVLSVLTPEARKIVVEGGHAIRHIKIKHADFDDREYLHVQYLGEDRHITGRKLEMDGRQFVKQYRTA
jgi:predicted LPLAT superfamily acyltransferase